jgi:hypothetical protein
MKSKILKSSMVNNKTNTIEIEMNRENENREIKMKEEEIDTTTIINNPNRKK